MFAAGPDAAGLPAAAGETGPGAGVDATPCVVGPGAAWLGAGDERGHSRNAPSAARASTMTAKASFRCADVRSISPGSYLRRRIGRSQNGVGGPASAGPAGSASAGPPPARPREVEGGGRLLAGPVSAGPPAPPQGGQRPPTPPRQGPGGRRPGPDRRPAWGQGGRAGDVPPRDQPAGGGGPASPSRGGRTSGGGSLPAPLLPFPSPRARPRLAAPARESEPACAVSWSSAPSSWEPAPLTACPLGPLTLPDLTPSDAAPSAAAAVDPAPSALAPSGVVPSDLAPLDLAALDPAAAAPAKAPAAPAVAICAPRLAACAGLRRAHRPTR